MKNALYIGWIILFACFPALNCLGETPILLQSFHWESYRREEAERLSLRLQLAPNSQGVSWWTLLNELSREWPELGFSGVWLPPATQAFAGNGRDAHSRGYMPGDLYDLNSSYGSEAELRNLLKQLKGLKISPIADIVVNHRLESGFDAQGCPYFRNPDWGAWALARGETCATGAQDSGKGIIFFDLDLHNDRVFRDLSDWLTWLRQDVGFEGWRWDYAKGYDGHFIEKWNAVTKPVYSIGEYWTELTYDKSNRPEWNQDAHRSQLMSWIDSTWGTELSPSQGSLAFDKTTKGILQEAVRSGEFWRLVDGARRPAGALGWWPEKSVTFVDNHDTGSTQQLWPFSANKDDVMLGYVYILTHPGVPMVFFDHLYYWGLKESIAKLMALRKDLDIQPNASFESLAAEQDLYVAKVGDKLVVKLGARSWKPGQGWRLAASGNRYAVWRRL